jgi:hypothetical protein
MVCFHRVVELLVDVCLLFQFHVSSEISFFSSWISAEGICSVMQTCFYCLSLSLWNLTGDARVSCCFWINSICSVGDALSGLNCTLCNSRLLPSIVRLITEQEIHIR